MGRGYRDAAHVGNFRISCSRKVGGKHPGWHPGRIYGSDQRRLVDRHSGLPRRNRGIRRPAAENHAEPSRDGRSSLRIRQRQRIGNNLEDARNLHRERSNPNSEHQSGANRQCAGLVQREWDHQVSAVRKLSGLSDICGAGRPVGAVKWSRCRPNAVKATDQTLFVAFCCVLRGADSWRTK
jgi:hypothetical protein